MSMMIGMRGGGVGRVDGMITSACGCWGKGGGRRDDRDTLAFFWTNGHGEVQCATMIMMYYDTIFYLV